MEDNVIFVILSKKGWKKWDFFSFPIFNNNKYNYNLLFISLLSEGKKMLNTNWANYIFERFGFNLLVEKFRRPNRRTIDMFSLRTSLSSVYNPSQRSTKPKYNEFEKRIYKSPPPLRFVKCLKLMRKWRSTKLVTKVFAIDKMMENVWQHKVLTGTQWWC